MWVSTRNIPTSVGAVLGFWNAGLTSWPSQEIVRRHRSSQDKLLTWRQGPLKQLSLFEACSLRENRGIRVKGGWMGGAAAEPTEDQQLKGHIPNLAPQTNDPLGLKSRSLLQSLNHRLVCHQKSPATRP